MYKILHLIDSLGYGGTEHQLVLNVQGIQGAQFQNYVCYLHAPNDLEPGLAKVGVPVYELGVDGKYEWAKGVMRLRKLVKSLDIDLIHTNLYESDIIGGIVGRWTNRPVVSTTANLCFESYMAVDNRRLSSLKLEIARLLRLVVARTCNDHLISVSQCVADSAQRRLKITSDKTTVIHRALPQYRLEPPDAERVQTLRDGLNLPQHSPVLLNVGRLVFQKGQEYLVQAMAQVVHALPSARLLIAGDGHLRSELVSLRDRLGLTDKQVTFLGQRDDIQELLEVADAFVFPSLFEGCPNALIEAMAMGKPCVASSIGPVEEIIQDGVTGVLVPVRSAEALASAIMKLTTSGCHDAAEMGNRARAVSRQRFTVAAAVEKLENLYHKVLESRYGECAEPSRVGAGRS